MHGFQVGKMLSLIIYTLFRQLLIVYLAAFYVVCGLGVAPDTEFGAKNKPSKIAKKICMAEKNEMPITCLRIQFQTLAY